MKPIYILQNDDCGILAVFGNIKAAFDFATKRQSELYPENDICHELDRSYPEVSVMLKGTVNYPVYLDNGAETSITCLELNRTDY